MIGGASPATGQSQCNQSPRRNIIYRPGCIQDYRSEGVPILPCNLDYRFDVVSMLPTRCKQIDTLQCTSHVTLYSGLGMDGGSHSPSVSSSQSSGFSASGSGMYSGFSQSLKKHNLNINHTNLFLCLPLVLCLQGHPSWGCLPSHRASWHLDHLSSLVEESPNRLPIYHSVPLYCQFSLHKCCLVVQSAYTNE